MALLDTLGVLCRVCIHSGIPLRTKGSRATGAQQLADQIALLDVSEFGSTGWQIQRA